MGLRSTIKGLFNKKQDFLEADPYWETKDIPINTFKNKAPFTSKVVSTKRIVGAKATGETCHIIMDHQGKMPYWEGQSYGVIPPGTNPKNGKPNSVRLYSIASSRYGDDMTGTTTSLCVRRANYWCPELKADDPAKKGVCSNFLCDTKPGDEVMLTGPSGKVMLIPEKDPKADLIMVATGTGIAPYRSIIRRLFVEKTPCASLQKRVEGSGQPDAQPGARGAAASSATQRDAARRTVPHPASPPPPPPRLPTPRPEGCWLGPDSPPARGVSVVDLAGTARCTRALHGSFSVSPTPTPCCTMTSGRRWAPPYAHAVHVLMSGSKSARPARQHSQSAALSPYLQRTRCMQAVTACILGCDPRLSNPRLEPYASQVLKSHPDNFKLDYALSREAKNKDGGKMYIQDKVAEYSDEVFTRMDNVRPPHTHTHTHTRLRHEAMRPQPLVRSVGLMRVRVAAGIAPSHRGHPSHRACSLSWLLIAGRAHVLLRPQGHDAGHPDDARGRLQGEGRRLGGQAQGLEEERPVARRGLLNSGRIALELEVTAAVAP